MLLESSSNVKGIFPNFSQSLFFSSLWERLFLMEPLAAFSARLGRLLFMFWYAYTGLSKWCCSAEGEVRGYTWLGTYRYSNDT